ncbi:MAG: winged helix-turn-helix transcriptional regulator [Succinivibrionaceae bacterium]|jgi:ArsR family transcriptional regulator|nr:winged helix-turn-helix transcriptional regulator [Succinivibrionaceae bacterium]
MLEEKPDDLYEETGDESDEEKMYELADLFKIFGDSTRLRILTLLAKGQKCVSAISEELSMTQSAVSHQLRILRQSKLVKGCRSGRNIEYALADDHVKTIISQGLEHIEE